MGMSSSQARLLNLTARMHQIEYKAAKLEAQKLQMANESRRVYDEYLASLEATRIQFHTLNNQGSIDYMDATYNSLVAHGYVLRMEGDEGEMVTQSDINNYRRASDNFTSFGANNRECFAALQTGRVTGSHLANGDVFEIYTAQQLAQVLSSNRQNLKFRLMCDIDLSSVNYTPKNFQNCQIDGNGHRITGLNKALFNKLEGSTSVSNLSLEGSITNSGGLLANTVDITGVISNVSASGTLLSTHANSGGLIGLIKRGTVEYCSSSVNVNSNSADCGGLIGAADGTYPHMVVIHDSSATGTVSSTNRGVGGFIGRANNVNISNCTSSGDVRGNYIDNTVEGYSSYAAGFVGTLYAQSGETSRSVITNCASTSDVYVAGSGAGGFVAQFVLDPDSTISNCSSSGTIYYNCACNTSEGLATLEDLQNESGVVNQEGGFVAILKGGQIENCDSTSLIVNAWTEDVGNDCVGDFCGRALISGGDNVMSGNYAPGDDFIGYYNVSVPANAGVVGTSVAAPNVSSTITPASAPAFTQQTVDEDGADEARALFDRMHENGYCLMLEDDPRVTHGDDPVWLSNMINEGLIYLFKPDRNNELNQTSVSTDTALQEVSDETMIRQAEAKYESDMRKIDRKERKYDKDLAELDNERNAIKQEIDTLKTVAKENVERTFKLFS